MQLERIALNLRRRNAWEALDLGHAMLRAWAGPAYRVWFATYWPVSLAILALLWQWPAVAPLVVWWLKPMFDRILLWVYSRSLFGTPTRLADIWRALPQILKEPGIVAGLTWRRLSLARSFLLPVWQLERQGGAAARARFSILSRRTRGNAIWLTFVCANTVTVLWLAQIFLIEWLIPAGSDGVFSLRDFFSGDLPPWQAGLTNLLWLTAETLVEPLYVASGFSLYLNRRSELEGWDIDLAFRRLAARHAETGSRLAAFAAALLLGLLVAAAPAPAQAADAPEDPATEAPTGAGSAAFGEGQGQGETTDKRQIPAVAPVTRAKPVIAEVLADPVFGKETEEMIWRERQSEAKPDDKPADWMLTVKRLLELFSEASRVLAWVVAALVAAGFIWLLIRYRDRWLPERLPRALPPEALFGLDVRPQSLPADVVGAARAALAAGRIEEALSLLYRGALVALIHQLQVDFQAGDTEGDCLRRVDRRLEPAGRQYFGQLIDRWRAAAYARRLPDAAAVETLCAQWSQHFDLAGGAR